MFPLQDSVRFFQNEETNIQHFQPKKIYVLLQYMFPWVIAHHLPLAWDWIIHGHLLFSPIGVSILGSKCSLKYDLQINETSLLESNNDGIWTPLLDMLTLGHFSKACCMILILAWAKILWLDSYLKTLSISGISFGPALAAPLPWSL